MRKISLLVVALVMAAGAYAQSFSFGAKVGLNLADLTMENTGMKPGLYIGATAEYGFSDKFAIAPELLYSMQGFKQSEDGFSTSLATNYINIPIMAKYYILDRLSVSAGPQIGFCLGGNSVTKIGNASSKGKLTEYNAFDFAIGIGAAYTVWNNLSIEARYNFGLTNLAKSSENSSKNLVLQIGAAYKF